MPYDDVCKGTPEVDENITGIYGSPFVVMQGSAIATNIFTTSRCLDTVQLHGGRYRDVNFHMEIRDDDAGKPKGKPLESYGRLLDVVLSYTELSTSPYGDWIYISPMIVLAKTGVPYWVIFVPSDFYDSPIYRVAGYERFGFHEAPYPVDSKYKIAQFSDGVWGLLTSHTLSHATYKKTYTCPTPALNMTIPA